MFVLLYIAPDYCEPEERISVIAISASKEKLERCLAAYRYRHQAACEDYEAVADELDNRLGTDSSPEHDHALGDTAAKYNVESSGELIPEPEACFQILEVLNDGDDDDDEPSPQPLPHHDCTRFRS